MRVKKRAIVCFLLPCLLLFVFVYLVPIIIVFFTSLFEYKSGGVFRFIGLENYIEAVVYDKRLHKALANTGIWALLQSTIHVGIGTVTAIILSRKRRGWKVLRTIYMIPNVVSASALGIIFLNVFNAKYGLINSFVSMVTGKDFNKNWFFDNDSAFITVTWSWLLYAGLIMILVLAGLSSIPNEITEAAKIDGATKLQIDFKVKLPMIRTVMGTCLILSSTSMLREFELIFLTTNGGPGTITLNLPLYLYKTSLIDNNYGYANMMGVLLIVLGVIVVYCINKIFRMNDADY
ncbi:ABC transporter permease subunit [Anaerocolumna sedimenticola]|uniref:ABC transporter permease subunit n=1 Tax=Anaerocolumna sedimenticola TaxID=2696063 RepID=A0A6P1TH05_9FIRM|nr:sugar ABC transporter permease [Anaerocolumna sedimenticola]QHQ59587.1 ABC transporter permease subunit [Anaerocolumna sedimenticola]